MIKKREIVRVEDISSDDDEGTNAWLKSGQAKKDALREKERIKNLRQQKEGTKPSDEGAGQNPSAASSSTTVDPSPKRSRRGQPSTCSAAVDVDDDEEVDPADADLLAESAALERKARQARERQQHASKAFDLDDDDGDEDSPPQSRRKRVRGGGASASSVSGAAKPGMRRIWLKVLCDDNEETVGCVATAPLASGELVSRVAKILCIDSSRVVLRREGDGAEALDLSRTPLELGLAEGSKRLVADEMVETKLSLKLHRAGESATMEIAPTATFASLVERYCAEHGGGTFAPGQVRLVFDGEDLAPSQTPAGCELEDDDLIDVIIK